MGMIVHQAIGEALESIAFPIFLNAHEITPEVGFVKKDFLAIIAFCADVKIRVC